MERFNTYGDSMKSISREARLIYERVGPDSPSTVDKPQLKESMQKGREALLNKIADPTARAAIEARLNGEKSQHEEADRKFKEAETEIADLIRSHNSAGAVTRAQAEIVRIKGDIDGILNTDLMGDEFRAELLIQIQAMMKKIETWTKPDDAEKKRQKEEADRHLQEVQVDVQRDYMDPLKVILGAHMNVPGKFDGGLKPSTTDVQKGDMRETVKDTVLALHDYFDGKNLGDYNYYAQQKVVHDAINTMITWEAKLGLKGGVNVAPAIKTECEKFTKDVEEKVKKAQDALKNEKDPGAKRELIRATMNSIWANHVVPLERKLRGVIGDSQQDSADREAYANAIRDIREKNVIPKDWYEQESKSPKEKDDQGLKDIKEAYEQVTKKELADLRKEYDDAKKTRDATKMDAAREAMENRAREVVKELVTKAKDVYENGVAGPYNYEDYAKEYTRQAQEVNNVYTLGGKVDAPAGGPATGPTVSPPVAAETPSEDSRKAVEAAVKAVNADPNIEKKETKAAIEELNKEYKRTTPPTTPGQRKAILDKVVVGLPNHQVVEKGTLPNVYLEITKKVPTDPSKPPEGRDRYPKWVEALVAILKEILAALKEGNKLTSENLAKLREEQARVRQGCQRADPACSDPRQYHGSAPQCRQLCQQYCDVDDRINNICGTLDRRAGCLQRACYDRGCPCTCARITLPSNCDVICVKPVPSCPPLYYQQFFKACEQKYGRGVRIVPTSEGPNMYVNGDVNMNFINQTLNYNSGNTNSEIQSRNNQPAAPAAPSAPPAAAPAAPSAPAASSAAPSTPQQQPSAGPQFPSEELKFIRNRYAITRNKLDDYEQKYKNNPSKDTLQKLADEARYSVQMKKNNIEEIMNKNPLIRSSGTSPETKELREQITAIQNDYLYKYRDEQARLGVN